MWQAYTDLQPDDRFNYECEAFQWDNLANFNQDGIQMAVTKGDWVVRYKRISLDPAEKDKPKDRRQVSKGWYYTAYTNTVFAQRFVLSTKPKKV